MSKKTGIHRLLKANFEVPVRHSLGDLGGVVVYSRGGPTHAENEDAALLATIGDDVAVLLVADGMGGARGGAAAARAVVMEVTEACNAVRAWWQNGEGKDERTLRLRCSLVDALERANRRITRSHGGGGTTALIALVVDERVQLLNVGDSQGLLVGQRGKVKYMTTAQSPIGYAVEAGVLEYDDALLHPARHVLSNAVGTKAMSIEIGPWLRVAKRDTLLMGSDGLFDNLFGMELVDLSRRGSLPQAARRICELASERMRGTHGVHQPSKPDDLTFLLYRRAESQRRKKASSEAGA